MAEKNETFENYAKAFGLSPSNLEFLDSLQSEECKKILITNKLKIHVETGIFIMVTKIQTNLFMSFLLNIKIQLKVLLIISLISAIAMLITLIG